MTLKQRYPAFTDRRYRLFWAAQIISLTGVWMQSVAQGWLVYRLSFSPAILALTAIALTAPVLVLSVFGGLAADCLNRRQLLIITQCAASVPAFMLWYLSAQGTVNVEWVIALAATTGIVNAFEYPARNSFLAELVAKESLTSAVTLQSVAFNATRAVGSAAAGFIIAVWGVEVCFIINGFSYLIGAFLCYRIGATFGEESEETVTDRRIPKGLHDGIKFIFSHKELLYVLVIVASVSLFGIPFIPMLPIFADGILGTGVQGLGLLSAVAGVGALIAALMVSSRPEIDDKERNIVAAAGVFAFGLFMFAHSRTMIPAMASLLAVGWGIVIMLALANCLIQHSCPGNMRGRIMAMFSFSVVGLTPVGHAIMGIAADRFGVVNALSVCSVICALVIITAGSRLLRKEAERQKSF